MRKPNENTYDMRITNKVRGRVIIWILWPESTNIEMVDRLIEHSNITAARSPLHDRDVYDRTDVEEWLWRHHFRDYDLEGSDNDLMAYIAGLSYDGDIPWIGDLKKPHYHYIAIFDGSKGLNEMTNIVGGATEIFYKAKSKRGSLKYLIHKNRPEKAQYDFEQIRAFGGLDLSPILEIGEIEQVDYLHLIEDYVLETKCNSYSRLYSWVRKQNDFNLEKAFRSNQYHLTSLMSSLGYERHKAKSFLGQTPKGLEVIEGSMFKEQTEQQEQIV